MAGERAGRAVGAEGGGGEFQDAREAEVGAVRRDRRGVAGEQVGERAGRGAQRHGEAGLAVAGPQGGADDGHDGTRARVEDRAAGRSPAEAQRVPASRADRQFQHVLDDVDAVGGGVRHGGRRQDARLAPAAGEEAHVGARVDPVPGGDRQRGYVQALGADQGEVQLGERGDRVRGDLDGALVGGEQDQPGQSVDRFVAGDDGAVVVGDEAGAAGAAGEVPDADQGGVGGGTAAVIVVPPATPTCSSSTVGGK